MRQKGGIRRPGLVSDLTVFFTESLARFFFSAGTRRFSMDSVTLFQINHRRKRKTRNGRGAVDSVRQTYYC